MRFSGSFFHYTVIAFICIVLSLPVTRRLICTMQWEDVVEYAFLNGGGYRKVKVISIKVGVPNKDLAPKRPDLPILAAMLGTAK